MKALGLAAAAALSMIGQGGEPVRAGRRAQSKPLPVAYRQGTFRRMAREDREAMARDRLYAETPFNQVVTRQQRRAAEMVAIKRTERRLIAMGETPIRRVVRHAVASA